MNVNLKYRINDRIETSLQPFDSISTVKNMDVLEMNLNVDLILIIALLRYELRDHMFVVVIINMRNRP